MSTKATDSQLVAVVLVALGIVLLLPTLVMGFGMLGFGPTMGGMWGYAAGGSQTGPGWMLIAGTVMQLLFLVVIVGVGYLLYRTVTRSSRRDQALDELRLAYARGNLTDDEYETRHEKLERER